jgi:hypothetical protein
MARRKMIDDPRRPFRLRVGVPYRVEKVDGELAVRAIEKRPILQMSRSDADLVGDDLYAPVAILKRPHGDLRE